MKSTNQDKDDDEFDVRAIYKNLNEPLNLLTFKNAQRGRLSNNLTRLALSKDIPSLTQIPERAKLLSNLIKVSDLYNTKGYNEAEKYFNKLNSGYSIDKNLSNTEGVVFYKGNKAIIAFRGTEPLGKIKSGLGKGMIEPLMWSSVLLGTESKHDQFKNAENQIKKAQQKYQVEELTGFSLGGNKSILYGDKLNIKTTTFNPFLGKSILQNNPSSKHLRHEVYRTQGDIATIGLNIFKPKINLNINSLAGNPSIKTVVNFPNFNRSTNELLSLVSQVQSHKLENFTSDIIDVNSPDEMAKRMMTANNKWGEADIQLKMNNAIDEGLTYAEYLQKFNKSDADAFYNENTKKYELRGNRVGRGTTQYEMWEQTSNIRGKTPFTDLELDHINTLSIPEEGAIRPLTMNEEELRFLRQINPEEHTNIMDKYLNEISTAGEPIIQNIRGGNNITSQLLRNITNASRATSGVLGSAIAGYLTMEGLKLAGVKLENLQPEVGALITGSTGGLATEVLLARLIGGSFAPKSLNLLKGGLSGAIGAISQEATARGLSALLSQTGMNEDAVNITSQSIGGAVGGAITTATIPMTSAITSSFLGAVGEIAGLETAFLSSVEVGSAGGLVGIGIGAVIGGLIAGGMAIGQALQPKNDYLLLPDRQKQADQRIGQDYRVIAILEEFNKNADFSQEAITNTQNQIKSVALTLEEEGEIMPNYNFQAKLTPTPRGYLNVNINNQNGSQVSSGMLNAEYPENFINTGVRTQEEQIEHQINLSREQGTRPTKEYIQNLNTDEREILNIIHSEDPEIDFQQFTPEDIANILGYTVQEKDTQGDTP